MSSDRVMSATSRRRFLGTTLSVACLACTGCTSLLAQEKGDSGAVGAGLKHKFQGDAGMSYEEVFRFAFRGTAQILSQLEQRFGSETFHKALREACSQEVAKSVAKYAQTLSHADLDAFAEIFRKPRPLWQNALTYEIVEDSTQAFELHVSECLWAKIMRDCDAADLGYSKFCFPDYAMAQAFNPKLRMIRSKTLMQGDSHCNHRYVMEA